MTLYENIYYKVNTIILKIALLNPIKFDNYTFDSVHVKV